MKIFILFIIIGILSCVKTFEVSTGIPIDTTTVKIIKIDTMTIGEEKILKVYYREKK